MIPVMIIIPVPVLITFMITIPTPVLNWIMIIIKTPDMIPVIIVIPTPVMIPTPAVISIIHNPNPSHDPNHVHIPKPGHDHNHNPSHDLSHVHYSNPCHDPDPNPNPSHDLNHNCNPNPSHDPNPNNDPNPCACSSPGAGDGSEVLAALRVGAELRQRQVLPVALLRDRAALGGLPGRRLVPVYRVSFCVCNGGWKGLLGGGDQWLIGVLIDDCLYIAILHSLEQTHCACVWFYMSD